MEIDKNVKMDKIIDSARLLSSHCRYLVMPDEKGCSRAYLANSVLESERWLNGIVFWFKNLKTLCELSGDEEDFTGRASGLLALLIAQERRFCSEIDALIQSCENLWAHHYEHHVNDEEFDFDFEEVYDEMAFRQEIDNALKKFPLQEEELIGLSFKLYFVSHLLAYCTLLGEKLLEIETERYHVVLNQVKFVAQYPLRRELLGWNAMSDEATFRVGLGFHLSFLLDKLSQGSVLRRDSSTLS